MNINMKQSVKQILDINLLKSHLRIAHDHEDEYLKEIICSATEILENAIESPILTKSYKYTFFNDEFKSSRRITLPFVNVCSIDAVRKVVNLNKKEKVPFYIRNENGRTIVITSQTKYPIEIKYTAGLTDKERDVPGDLKLAILQIAKNIYECKDQNILDSAYLQNIIASYRPLSI